MKMKTIDKIAKRVLGLGVIAICVIGGCFMIQSIYNLSQDTVISEQANPSYEDPNLDKNALVNGLKYAGENTVDGVVEGAGIVADDAVTLGSGMVEDGKEVYTDASGALSDKLDSISMDNLSDQLEERIDGTN